MDTLAKLRAGQFTGATSISLKDAGLTSLPLELASLASTLEQLDCSNNPSLSSLPSASTFPWHAFTRLKVVFLASCAFATFPAELGLCPALSMVGFRSNRMRVIPEGALPGALRWLILTGNELEALPDDIGRCARLEKCMLAGNQLTSLPASMADCASLTLLRLASNQLPALPAWLLDMPKLAFLAFAGNPCVPAVASPDAAAASATPDVSTAELAVGAVLGRGASGVISQARWKGEEVAVKVFHSSLITSDGAPADELAASLLAGQHPNLISVLGRLIDPRTAPPTPLGTVLSLLPPTYTILGLPPTFGSCTRDVFPASFASLSAGQAQAILRGVAAAAAHCHSLGLAHGDLYAHNILFDPAADSERGHVLLTDFGAAVAYGRAHAWAAKVERVEVRAFGHLVEDVLGLVVDGEGHRWVGRAKVLQAECVRAEVGARPAFEEVVERLR